MYPDDRLLPSHDEPEHDFTIIEQEELEVTDLDATEPVPLPSSSSRTPPPSLNLESVTDSTYTVTTRRHQFPQWLPLLTLVRYLSTVHLAEIVTTSFTSSGIHHSAVSKHILSTDKKLTNQNN